MVFGIGKKQEVKKTKAAAPKKTKKEVAPKKETPKVAPAATKEFPQPKAEARLITKEEQAKVDALVKFRRTGRR